MRRPRTSPLIAVVLAVPITVVGLTTANAAQPAQPVAAPLAAAPAVLTALSRDLGLAPAQAVARLDAERTATKADHQVRATLGGDLAGTWFDAARGGLVVGVTSASAFAEVRAVGAEPRLLARSAAALDAAKTRLDAAAAGAPALPGWRVDQERNAVVVKHAPGAESKARAWVSAAGVDQSAVRYESSTERARPLIDVVGGNRYWTSKYGCSVGFSVQGGFISAGHCGKVGETTTQPGGRFDGSTFPVDDMAFIRTSAGETPIGAVNDYSGGRVAVAGAQEAPVGASICRSGGTTGWHCGTIRYRNATVDYGSQVGKVYEAIETTACAEPGDSGGSAISGQQAQGVTSGGSGDCKGGAATTYFQPVPEILSRYNVTLLTSDGPGEPPGGQCGTATTGSVNQGGTVYEPRATGSYQAAAGKHTACLAGPSGSDFDLYLEKQSGTRWSTVATSAGPSATEKVDYTGTAGRYRWRINAYRGSGAYTLEAKTP
ncbi:S1 family peptidase [Actinokineospora auranticolor]|uniref:Streptogrisin C n=1 Tax=Actinokineospora auranticolor TaxID=155976 RepID=A0A2S6GME2_9PSEU|nr:S1 family peptidase [Actinokineospora auranticolor]PPK66343.1 streptogrisin C [Actinokineospora auranticolor]